MKNIFIFMTVLLGLITWTVSAQSSVTIKDCSCTDTIKITASYDYTAIYNSENFQKMIRHPKTVNIKYKKENCFRTSGIDTLHSFNIYREKINANDSVWSYNKCADLILVASSKLALTPSIDVCDLPKGNYVLILNIGIYSERMILKIK